jgi:hypothetical protein
MGTPQRHSDAKPLSGLSDGETAAGFDLHGFHETDWHEIAERSPTGTWRAIYGAPVSQDDARDAAEHGLLTVTTRFEGLPGAQDRRCVLIARLTDLGRKIRVARYRKMSAGRSLKGKS